MNDRDVERVRESVSRYVDHAREREFEVLVKLERIPARLGSEPTWFVVVSPKAEYS